MQGGVRWGGGEGREQVRGIGTASYSLQGEMENTMNNMELGLWGQGRWWNTKIWHSNQQTGMNDMAEGMRAVMGRSTEKMDQIAENLSNASTPGYRSGCVLPKNFVGELHGRLVGHQWRVGTDMSTGAIRLTDRPLDFALEGDGFFVVRSANGDFLTRNGSFEMMPDGTIVGSGGFPVVGGNNEPIRVPGGISSSRIEADENGTLRADGVEVGQLRVERVADEKYLRRVGTAMFAADPEAREVVEAPRVVGRALESSNTTIYQEMADMMVLQRSVEAAQRAQTNEHDAQRKMMEALT